MSPPTNQRRVVRVPPTWGSLALIGRPNERAQLVCSRPPPLSAARSSCQSSVCVWYKRAIDGICRNDEDISNRHSFYAIFLGFSGRTGAWGLASLRDDKKLSLKLYACRRQLFWCEGFCAARLDGETFSTRSCCASGSPRGFQRTRRERGQLELNTHSAEFFSFFFFLPYQSPWKVIHREGYY